MFFIYIVYVWIFQCLSAMSRRPFIRYRLPFIQSPYLFATRSIITNHPALSTQVRTLGIYLASEPTPPTRQEEDPSIRPRTQPDAS